MYNELYHVLEFSQIYIEMEQVWSYNTSKISQMLIIYDPFHLHSKPLTKIWEQEYDDKIHPIFIKWMNLS